MWRGLPLHAAWIGGAVRLRDSFVCGGEGGGALALLEGRGGGIGVRGRVALQEAVVPSGDGGRGGGAGALASGPRLLLPDEPMAGLNSVEIERFIELIRRVSKEGATVLVVEHVMKAIMSVSRRVIVLHAGLKLAEGTPETIMANKDVVAVYLGADYAKS